MAWVAAMALKGKAVGGQSLCQCTQRVMAEVQAITDSLFGALETHVHVRFPIAQTNVLLDWLLLPLVLKLSPPLPLVLLLLSS